MAKSKIKPELLDELLKDRDPKTVLSSPTFELSLRFTLEIASVTLNNESRLKHKTLDTTGETHLRHRLR